MKEREHCQLRDKLSMSDPSPPSSITDKVDSRDPKDCVSRLLRLLERSRGDEDGEPSKDRGSKGWGSSDCSRS